MASKAALNSSLFACLSGVIVCLCLAIAASKGVPFPRNLFVVLGDEEEDSEECWNLLSDLVD